MAGWISLDEVGITLTSGTSCGKQSDCAGYSFRSRYSLPQLRTTRLLTTLNVRGAFSR